MKKIQLSLLFVVCTVALGLQSCNNGKTYAEMKEEEADAIERFKSKLTDSIGATFISESQFIAQDSMTKANEFVLFDESGVYMNISYKGDGDKVLEDGDHDMLTRFMEIAIQSRDNMFSAGDTLAGNLRMNSYPSSENFKVTISGNSYSGSFQERNSIMYQTYSSTAVPSGWLLPLRFLKVGRTTDSKKIARVRLIVPHSEGSSLAMQYVYPCYYEITYSLAK